MYKKFKDKLHIGSPGSGRRSPSPNARNAGDESTRWETLLNATQTTLAIAKESVAGLPVPGLEAAIGGLLKVLTIYQGMKSNEEAIKSFNEAVVRLNDNVAAPLKAAIASQSDFIDDDLQKRLELLAKDLTDLTKRANTMSSRERHQRFFSSQDDVGIIQELNRELDRIVMAFAGRCSISAEMEARKTRRSAQTLLIDKLPRAKARHNSASRAGANPCFQGTRDSILKEISAWIDDPNAPTIFWLSGMAGIGKSTIAHTIAEQEDQKHRLGATFFFSRDEADRRDPHLVYPTIAFQLAGFDSSLREPIAQALEQDADIGFAVMRKQFEHLIAGPLAKLKLRGKTILFVLDALDECSPASGAIEILSRWALELPKISNQIGAALKVLITSRPELHIHNQFTSSSLRLISQSFVLHDIEKSVVRADIERFLTQRLVDLAILHQTRQPWPTDAEVHALASRSDNLFIFASTAVKFIGGANTRSSLQYRLDRLLKPEQNERTSAFAHLDALYYQVLQDAENNLKENISNSKETFRLVLETIVLLLDPLPSTSLAAWLSLQHDDVITTVQDLRSILVIPAASESSEPIRFFHPSFYDFITTPGRHSGRFSITSAEGHARLAKLCLETMHSLLKEDPCSLGSPWVLHSDVADLQVRLDVAAPTHLRYSCRFFGSHISLSPRGDEALGHLLDVFCESKLLMWLEMMSLLGNIDGAIHSIQLLKSWCHNNPGVQKLTSDLVLDTYRVLLQFQSPLRLSSGHLYSTVLSFTPACSLAKQYGSQRRANYVVHGQPAQWDANLITADAQSKLRTLAYFPDGKRIVTAGDKGPITVWNSSTGAEISSLCESEGGVSFKLDVSGDGARIAGWESPARKFSIGIWDTATGALVSRLETFDTTSNFFQRIYFARFIANGLELLTISDPSTLRRWNSDTGQILSTHKLGINTPSSAAVSRCGSVVAVQDDDFLRIWELRADDTMSLMQTLSKVGGDQVFILDNRRVLSLRSRSTYGSAKLWDYRTGLKLKAIEIPRYSHGAVCNEGKRMAFVTSNLSSLQVWDIESGTMLGQLFLNTDISNLVFSPTEMVLASTSENSLQTWDITEIISGGSSATPGVELHDWAGFSADRQGAGAIMTCQATKTVRVWNILEKSYSTLDVPDISGSSVMSPDGSCFACQTSGPMKRAGWVVYETKSLQRLQTLPTRITGIRYPGGTKPRTLMAVFSGDSRRIAIGEVAEKPVNVSTIKVWDIHQSQMLYEGTFLVRADGLAFLLNGTSLLVVHGDGHLVLDLLSSGDNVDMVKWRLPWSIGFNSLTVGGVVPDGVHFPLIRRGWISGPIQFYLFNMQDPSQKTKYKGSSVVFQIIETGSGYEPVFLEYDGLGNLYKRSGNSKKLLCWLPRSWRFENGIYPNAVWRGSYLIVGLRNGEIGIIDIDALSE